MKKFILSAALISSVSLVNASIVNTALAEPSSISGKYTESFVEKDFINNPIQLESGDVVSIPSKTSYDFAKGILTSNIQMKNTINVLGENIDVLQDAILTVNFANKTGNIDYKSCSFSSVPSTVTLLCKDIRIGQTELNNIQYNANALKVNEVANGNYYSTIDFTAKSLSQVSNTSFDLSLKLLSVDENGQLLFDGGLVPAEVPLPAGVWLFGSALLGLTALRKK